MACSSNGCADGIKSVLSHSQYTKSTVVGGCRHIDAFSRSNLNLEYGLDELLRMSGCDTENVFIKIKRCIFVISFVVSCVIGSAIGS
ncbi:hypothetical protein CHS0354_023614 [Potamilus streckersoni]|uniref:Uncharacterized protein n=1 Tax=Potamilus streckersoni TaxID=2493646 RepID=A0AAE0SET0_9BIVA|nr:hypothetical protein CHS0354_023614 [Potamilus streckersoni]